MELPKIYIVILNWNHPKDTLDCLKSLEGLIVNKFKLYVVIVDNGSKDDSLSLFRKFKSSRLNIKIIENGKNLGFAGGNNVALRYAVKKGSDYILVLNNDTVVDKHLILGLLETSKIIKDAGIITPKIYFAKGFEFHKRYKASQLGRVIWSAGGRIDWNNLYATNIGVDEVDNGQFDDIHETDFATGAAMFVKTEVFKNYGFFNEKYFMYLEDVEFCERYKRGGGKVVYTPKSVLWHKVAQSSGIGSNLNDYFITRNRLLFGFTYASFRAKSALLRESLKFMVQGRDWQKKGAIDFYKCKYGAGSWPSE